MVYAMLGGEKPQDIMVPKKRGNEFWIAQACPEKPGASNQEHYDDPAQ